MATLYSNGIEELLLSMNDLANLPASVLTEMVKAEGEVILKAQKSAASSMLSGPYAKGYTPGKEILKPAQKSGDGAVTYATWTASITDAKHRSATRVAEIAFLNQYGTSKMPSRPFITSANESSQDAAISAAEAVYDKYLASLGF